MKYSRIPEKRGRFVSI